MVIVSDYRWEFRYEVDALPREILYVRRVGIVVEEVHRRDDGVKRTHLVVMGRPVQNYLPGFLRKASPLRELSCEGLEVLPARELAREQEIRRFFIAEPPLFLMVSHQIAYVVTAVIQLAVEVHLYLRSVTLDLFLVTYDLSFARNSHEDPRAVFVSETELNVLLPDKLRGYLVVFQ